MNRIYFIGLLLFGFIFSECADMNKLDCMLSVDCDWDENMVTGNCANFSSSSTCSNIDQCSWVSTQQACPNITAYSDCVAIPGCSYSWLTYTCGGTTTVTYCSGGSYEFDNGVCDEILMQECSGMNESQCSNDDSCDWIQNIEFQSCGIFNTSSECWEVEECYWYNGTYYSAFQGCNGEFEIDNSYCEDMQFIPGDTNQDFTINVLDVIMIVNLIIQENEYNELADLNNDGVNNIQDIIMVVQIILNG